MNSADGLNEGLNEGLNRTAQGSFLLAGIISLVSLLGWGFGELRVVSINPRYIPIAPSTAVCFGLQSFSVFFFLLRPDSRVRSRLSGVCAFLVLFVSLMILAGYFSGILSQIEHMTFRVPEFLADYPAGHMSPITAMTFLLSASGVLFLGIARRDGGRWFRLASLAGLGVLATGTVIVIGYLEGTPILYGGRIIPVALLTAVSFVLTGVGLITACGPQVQPVKSFVGASVQSKLMRSFFPVVVVFVFVDDYVYRWLLPEATNPAMKDALIDIVSVIMVGIIIAEIAKKVGAGMDRAREEKAAAEEELRETAQRLGLATNSGGLGVWDWDVSRNTMIWNDRMFELYGVAREDFPRCIDAWTNGLHPDDREAAIAECEAALRGERDFNTEFRVQHADGTIKWLKADAIIIRDATGAAVRMIGLNRDITEIRHAEDQVRLSLHERETLLRELYHRTKNNMQVISSLLSLQGASLGDPAVRQLFTDTRSRIQAMSLVHEKLYQSPDLSNVELGIYIRDLAESIMKSYKTTEGRIGLRLECEAYAAPIDFVTPLGLILNELMSNSLKYAFPDSGQGEIRIAVFRDGDGGITVRYGDSGRGLAHGIDLRRSKTLGMQLVYSLVEDQLGGKLEVHSGEGSGTEFVLRFAGGDA